MKKDKENTWHYEIALRQNAEFLPPEDKVEQGEWKPTHISLDKKDGKNRL